MADSPEVIARFRQENSKAPISPRFVRHIKLDPAKLISEGKLVYHLNNVKFENRTIDLIATNPIIDKFEETIGELKIDDELRKAGKRTFHLPPSSIMGILPVPATVVVKRLDKRAVRGPANASRYFE